MGVKIGATGDRSTYLSHAKRALYHLSYSPSARTGEITGKFQVAMFDLLFKVKYNVRGFRILWCSSHSKTNGGFGTVAKYVCQSLLKRNVFIINCYLGQGGRVV